MLAAQQKLVPFSKPCCDGVPPSSFSGAISIQLGRACRIFGGAPGVADGTESGSWRTPSAAMVPWFKSFGNSEMIELCTTVDTSMRDRSHESLLAVTAQQPSLDERMCSGSFPTGRKPKPGV